MNSLILRTTTRVLTPVIIAVSVYLLLRGHDAPGGGFIGGLVAGSVFVLHYLSYGPTQSRAIPVSSASMIGAGLVVAAFVGLAGMAAGGAFLESAVWKIAGPIVGEVKITASLFFDVGVFLAVVGAVVGVVRHLGEERRP